MSREQPTLGRRIWWVIKTTLMILILLAALVGLGYAAILGYGEIRRSFASVNARIDADASRIDVLGTRVAQLAEGNPEQARQIQALQSALAELEARLDTAQSDLADDLARQSALLAQLEAGMTDLTDTTAATLEDVTALGAAFLALQGDLSANTAQLDALGGQVDGLQGETEALDTAVTDLRATIEADAAAQMDTLQQTLVLFRVWELLTRARLRLVENNLGLAAADVETAVAALARVIAVSPPERLEALTRVQERLNLALQSLPGAPAVATADLENAWDELDGVLTELVLPALLPAAGEEAETAATEEAETEEAETEEAATPEAAATPTATPEPGATPTPTATPESEACIPTRPAGWLTHQVVAGDTLSAFAQAANVPVARILEANCLPPNAILSIGQVIFIPPPR